MYIFRSSIRASDDDNDNDNGDNDNDDFQKLHSGEQQETEEGRGQQLGESREGRQQRRRYVEQLYQTGH